jgi:hypothetical protein
MNIVCHPQAVRNLECFYDGHIPATAMDHAREIDAEFLMAHSEWYTMSENARYAREARAWMKTLIMSFRAAGVTAGQLSERNAKSIERVRDMFRTHHRLALAEAANKKEVAT